jgi:hypothetical protein
MDTFSVEIRASTAPPSRGSRPLFSRISAQAMRVLRGRM